MGTEAVKARLLRHVDVTEAGCWEWQGALVKDRYGHIRVGAKAMGTHRLAYLLWKGPIPIGYVVRHRCHNSKCCNPDHLLVGTHEDNVADRVARGLRNVKRASVKQSARKPGRPKGSRNLRPRITEVAKQEIVRLYMAGGITQQRLAEKFGCDQTYISLLLRAARSNQ